MKINYQNYKSVVARADPFDRLTVTRLRIHAAAFDRAQMAESMRYEMFVFSARDSSHTYTPEGVKLLSSATTDSEPHCRDRHQRKFYANVR